MAPTGQSPVTASLPALLRAGRATYGRAVKGALAERDYDDVPANGSYLLSGIARAGVPLSELITRLGVSKQTAGQLVDTLVVRGYLERSVDPADRRRSIVALTDRGAGAASVIRAAVEAVDAALAEQVGADKMKHARTALMALAELEDGDAHAHSQPLPPKPVAAAVLYVKSLGTMRTFYERCFGMSELAVSGGNYCVLGSADWEISLVSATEAVASTLELTVPPRRRENSAIKLSFEVADTETLRSLVAAVGGRVDPTETGWVFRGARHLDCIDPEGNVVQLSEPITSHQRASAILSDQDLTGREFSGLNLGGASLAGSNLTNTRFAGADLRKACFDGANLTNADLRGARLDDSSFLGANLTNASMVRARARSSDFAAANLTGSDLSFADFTSAKFRGASLMYADVEGADLAGADLTDSIGLRMTGMPARMPAGLVIADASITATT